MSKTERLQRARVRLLARSSLCYWCGQIIAEGQATIDHLVPRCRGGSDRDENLELACKTCNNARKARLPAEMEIPHVDRIKGAIGRLRSMGEEITADEIVWSIELAGHQTIGRGYVIEYLRRFGPVTTGHGRATRQSPSEIEIMTERRGRGRKRTWLRCQQDAMVPRRVASGPLGTELRGGL